MLDPRAISMFVRLAETRHFGRTAEALGVTQSVLSVTIRHLEDQLGSRLFDRGARRAVGLTRMGEIFLPEATAVLARFAEAERFAKLAARGEAGPIGIGYVFSAALCGMLADLIDRFGRAVPAVEVTLHLMDTPEQLEALRSGAIDVALLRSRPSYPPGVIGRPVHREELMLALARSHRLAHAPSIAAADLSAETFILPQFNEHIGIIETVRRIARAGRFALPFRRETSDFVATLALVAGGAGVALVPRSLTRMGMAGVIYREIADHRDEVSLSLCFRPDRMTGVLGVVLDAVESREPPGA